MKRTAEVVLSIIGALVYGFLAIIGGAMVWLQNNRDVLEETVSDPEMNQENMLDIDMMMETMGTGGWLFLITAIIAIVIGIVSMVLFKGNKSPKLAGILLLVVGVISTIATAGAGIFGGVFYVIAGIMGLVRKPKNEINIDQY
ncbi:DUF4064 domain-containing protein [Saliterribacillus persicus]|uniref:Uncharacterized protein DUF4064 n=1 Tax=Saliterribacillus persicus TaxID=930114 RepID=A0A368XYM8_9BACI|nr:DUF4064 domain-containing protein [Saliterribacillus persicus]RCW73093.1 uncharacterized protein DUF4064 [Saliterribacillus persicus]